MSHRTFVNIHRYRWSSKYPLAAIPRPAWLDVLLTATEGPESPSGNNDPSSLDSEREFLLSRIHTLVALIELDLNAVQKLLDTCPTLTPLQKDSVTLLFLASHPKNDQAE